MEATKHTITIEVEVLHPDSIRGLLIEVLDNMRIKENDQGQLQKSDGDCVRWLRVRKEVTI